MKRNSQWLLAFFMLLGINGLTQNTNKLTPTGNAGVGTITPDNPLVVVLPAIGPASYFKLSSTSIPDYSSYLGTTATNQYAWLTNLRYNGTAWVRDNAAKSGWKTSHVVATTDALSSFNVEYINPTGTLTPYFTVGGTGNVGIKTTAPAFNLDVNGTSRVTGLANFTDMSITGNIGMGIAPSSVIPINMKKSLVGTIGMRCENTSTAASSFSAVQLGEDINTAANKYLNVLYASSGTIASGFYQPQGSTVANLGAGGLNLATLDATGASKILFYTGSSATAAAKAAFDGTGKFGVGTVTPTALLHVKQSLISTPGFLLETGGGTSVSGITMRDVNNAQRSVNIYHDATNLYVSGQNAGTGAFTILGVSSTLNFATDASKNITFSPNGVEALRALPSGRLLVGSTTDAGDYKLQLNSALLLNGQTTEPIGVNGGIVYNATTNQFKGFRNGVWKNVLLEGDGAAEASNTWRLNGNGGTDAAQNSIGTTDAQDLVVKTNNTERLRIGAGGVFNYDGGATRDMVNFTNSNNFACWVAANINTSNPSAGVGYRFKINGTLKSQIFFNPQAFSFGTVLDGIEGNTDILSRAGDVYLSTSTYLNNGLIVKNGTGNVGIGVNNPTALFEVQGRVPATSIMALKNVSGVKVLEVFGSGTLQVSSLSGTAGSAPRMVVADAGGVLSSLPIPTGNSGGSASQWTTANTNIYFNTGSVGVGTTNVNDANFKLFVETGIRTRKVKVDQSVWADYVFLPSYKLLTLKEVEEYIKQHQHLPGVASEEEVKKEGLDLGENQATLLKKVEELTLYMIELKKQLDTQQKEIVDLKSQIKN